MILLSFELCISAEKKRNDYKIVFAIEDLVFTKHSFMGWSCFNVSYTLLRLQEVWTICRIFKRSVSHRKYTPDWREIASNRTSTATPSPQIICSMGLGSNIHETYIAFGSPLVQSCDEKPGFSGMNGRNQWHAEQLSIAQPSSMASSSSFSSCPENNDFFTRANWDELKSVVEFAFDPFSV